MTGRYDRYVIRTFAVAKMRLVAGWNGGWPISEQVRVPIAQVKRVNWQALQSVWPILLLLAYLLVTAVLTVLTYERKKHVDLHDRVRESLHMRHTYFNHLADRMRPRE